MGGYTGMGMPGAPTDTGVGWAVAGGGTAGGDQLELTGEALGEDPMPIIVTFGPVGSESKYTCGDIQSRTTTGLRCTVPEGVGKNLRFTVSVNGILSQPR